MGLGGGGRVGVREGGRSGRGVWRVWRCGGEGEVGHEDRWWILGYDGAFGDGGVLWCVVRVVGGDGVWGGGGARWRRERGGGVVWVVRVVAGGGGGGGTDQSGGRVELEGDTRGVRVGGEEGVGLRRGGEGVGAEEVGGGGGVVRGWSVGVSC